jgi:hypothetical protein
MNLYDFLPTTLVEDGQGYHVMAHKVYGKVLAHNGKMVITDHDRASSLADQYNATSIFKAMDGQRYIIKMSEAPLQSVEEGLTHRDPVEKWVATFKSSKHPKFAGKTPEQREKMARMAQYKAVQNKKLGEGSERRCQQCGMTDCTCAPGKCGCKPIAGWVPGKGFKKDIDETWSQKYKRSIDCSHPKGFSQRAHCAGKKKHNESVEMEMVCEDCGMCETHGNLNEIKKGQKDSNGYTRCWPGKHAEGTKKGKNGGQVRNCVPNESVSEAADPLLREFQEASAELTRLRYQPSLRARMRNR